MTYEQLVAEASFQRFQSRAQDLIDRGFLDRIELVRSVDTDQVQHVLGVGAAADLQNRPGGAVERTKGSSDLYAQTAGGHGGVEFAGGLYMTGWAPINDGAGHYWNLLVYVNATETYAHFYRLQMTILGVMCVIIILSGIVAYRFASSFEKTAVTDGLMQLYNHRYFKQRIEQEVARAARHKHPLTLVMLDIDHFKKVNDTWGHATGDIVLRLLGRWVKDQSRKTDVVARYGGEEVAIILTDTALAGGQLFAERLREFVASQTVRDPEENAEFKVTISVGCAQWERGMTFLDLIRAADTALYHSKSDGRNRVSVYHEDLLPRPEKQEVAKVKRG